MEEYKKMLSYISKYRNVIIVISVLLGILSFFVLSEIQTYTASAIILYKNSGAVDGLAADGTELDTSEIFSSEVMTKVFQELDLSYDEYNMDEIRAGITVEPVFTEEELAVREALNEQGETAEEEPTKYLVSYTVGNGDVPDAEKFASNLLKTMLDAYIETYAENHVNGSVALISVDGICDGNYDYIEIAEILDDSANTLREQVNGRADESFRSSETGYSYGDLNRKYLLLNSVDIPNAYAYILTNQITKDRDTLLAKYENRIETAKIENDVADLESEELQEIMDTYAAMIKECTECYQTYQSVADGTGIYNEDVTYEYILDDINDNWWYEHAESGDDDDDNGTWHEADQTTEYDTLLTRYVAERTELENELVDIAYYQYIIDVYSGVADSGADLQVESGNSETSQTEALGTDTPTEESDAADQTEDTVVEETGAADQIENVVAEETDTVVQTAELAAEGQEVPALVQYETSDEQEEEAYQMLSALAEKLDKLSRATVTTNQEYNRYAGAENISVMTDVVTTPGIALLLYTGIAFVLFIVLGCLLAIAGGKTSEMIDYYIYTDRKLEMPNRAACDRYISEYRGDVLPSDFACIAIQVCDINARNREFGRKKCDTMLTDFRDMLRQIFPSEKSYAAVNALGQFIVFIEGVDQSMVRAYVEELKDKCTDYNKSNECGISFDCGSCVCGDDQIYNIRKLMVCAINNTSPVVRSDVHEVSAL